MPDIKADAIVFARFDCPSETLVRKNTEHAPWHEDGRHANDKSQHGRYHGLFEDLMN